MKVRQSCIECWVRAISATTLNKITVIDKDCRLQHSFCTTLNCTVYFQADNFSTYNRLFHQRDDYDGKIHRDDRNHILKIGRAVHDEVRVHVSLLFVGHYF